MEHKAPDMSYNPEVNAQLPSVDQSDLLKLMLPEILDPSHSERWEAFTVEQPELAREIRNRLTNSISDIESRKIAMDEVSFAYAALTIAVQSDSSTSVSESVV